jgi:hypothetical protein
MIVLRVLAVWSVAGLMGSFLFGTLVRAGAKSLEFEAEMSRMNSVADRSSREMVIAHN